MPGGRCGARANPDNDGLHPTLAETDMAITLYQASVPAFTRGLQQLRAILAKADAQAEPMKVDAGVLLQSRLYPNMFPLVRQVQIACDFSKGTCSRLAGKEPPSFPDNEASFADLYARIDKTLAVLATLTPAQIDGQEERTIELKAGTRTLTFKGLSYLVGFSLPNFYFHLTTAYAILRHNGIELGKTDFIGPLD
jgi:uncharacterized protein